MTYPSKENYITADCNWCDKSGKERDNKEEPCGICNGTGEVLVERPPQPCAQCGGTGNGHENRRCMRCKGSGWRGFFITA